MTEDYTGCPAVDKKTTQYIERNISQKFIDTWLELADSKVPPPQILRGLSIAFAILISRTNEAKNSGDKIAKIIDDVAQVLKLSQYRGVDYPSQAAALGLCIPNILGIDYNNLKK